MDSYLWCFVCYSAFNKIINITLLWRLFFFSEQDTQLLLWDLVMDEIVVPLRRCPPGGSPTFSSGSQSSHWDNNCPVGTLQPAPSMRDVPKLSPVVAHRVHAEPLSGLIFTNESIVTVCREGHVKIWMRPGHGDSQTINPETVLSTSLKDKPVMSSKVGISSYKQWLSMLICDKAVRLLLQFLTAKTIFLFFRLGTLSHIG